MDFEELASDLGEMKGELSGVKGHLGSISKNVKDLADAVNVQNVQNENRLSTVETEVENVEKRVGVVEKDIKKKKRGKGYWPLVITLAVAILTFGGAALAAFIGG